MWCKLFKLRTSISTVGLHSCCHAQRLQQLYDKLASVFQVVQDPPASGGISRKPSWPPFGQYFLSKLKATFWIPEALVSMNWMNWSSSSVPINFSNSATWRWGKESSWDSQLGAELSHETSNSGSFFCSEDMEGYMHHYSAYRWKQRELRIKQTLFIIIVCMDWRQNIHLTQ